MGWRDVRPRECRWCLERLHPAQTLRVAAQLLLPICLLLSVCLLRLLPKAAQTLRLLQPPHPKKRKSSAHKERIDKQLAVIRAPV